MNIQNLDGKLQSDAGERMIGFQNGHAVGHIRHAPGAAVRRFAGHFVHELSHFQTFGMRKVLHGYAPNRIGIVFAKSFFRFEMNGEALAGEMPFERFFQTRKNIAFAMKINHAFGRGFFKRSARHICHHEGDRYQHALADCISHCVCLSNRKYLVQCAILPHLPSLGGYSLRQTV